MGVGGSKQERAMYDMEGWGVKNPDFRNDILFAWPLKPLRNFHYIRIFSVNGPDILALCNVNSEYPS